ncbi:hypothetical protein [Micromonospora sp. WMMD1082]|uniref:hypothetical protein n=1 Tax=Micromonospora sp. WMMD1082 TaxID=3016104 RepID=UPI00241604FA|nr:hypothetical protein [Micromonospora sp. WMMD1082]MDG4795392.1 hypothetical protein [Micromonospora sp. WMMD1082]
MSPQKIYTSAEKRYHEPDDCSECGEQMETQDWAPDDRLSSGPDRWSPIDACTNPECPRGQRASR